MFKQIDILRLKFKRKKANKLAEYYRKKANTHWSKNTVDDSIKGATYDRYMANYEALRDEYTLEIWKLEH